MIHSKLIKFAASGLVIGAATAGCKPATTAYRPASVSSDQNRSYQAGFDAYNEAQRALAKGDLEKALALMEQAVAWSPRDAGYRKGLAELYMKSGRFASAETTYADVLSLNPSDHRAGFYLALTRIAQGKTAAALAQLDQMDPSIAPADLGLAYAIAGHTGRALELLEPAARAADANGRTRQNLALAYALAGDWKKSRVTAAQDVSPTDLNKRMTQWAAIADPAATSDRVASLLNVTPNGDDAGQPTRLALAPEAASEPVAVALSEAAAPVEVAQAEVPAPVAAEVVPASAPVAVAVAASEPAPVTPGTAEQAKFVQAAQELVQTGDLAPRPIVPTAIPAYIPSAKAPKIGKGRFVVQIGAFRTSGQVEQAWAQAQRRYGFADRNQPLSTTVKVNGVGTMHRLSVSGFASQDAAARVCQSIKSRSGACFVRAVAGDAPVRWASRYTRKGSNKA